MIELKIKPVSKPRMTQRDKWSSRPCVERYFKFKEELNLLWKEREVPERCYLIFFIPMPKSWSKKKKQEMNGKPHQQKPDLDNLVKAFFDSLLAEDSQIYEIKASKFWNTEGKILVEDLREVDFI